MSQKIEISLNRQEQARLLHLTALMGYTHWRDTVRTVLMIYHGLAVNEHKEGSTYIDFPPDEEGNVKTETVSLLRPA